MLRRALSTTSKLRCVLLNAARVDFDGRINFEKLSAVADISRHEISAPSEVAARCEGHDIVMNKEMPLPGDLIRTFPPSVKLICEMGTGYNNIDLAAAKEMGIGVVNVPTYATEAMAHIAVTMVMALSWGRAHFVEPPPAAKYVSIGFLIMFALHVLPFLARLYYGELSFT